MNLNPRFAWRLRKAEITPENGTVYRTREVALCGSSGSSRENFCQLLKVTFLAILPGLVLILQNAVNLAGSVKMKPFQNTCRKRGAQCCENTELRLRKKRMQPKDVALQWIEAGEDPQGFKIILDPIKGRGIVTTMPRKAGDFLLQYCGEIITGEEGERREDELSSGFRFFFGSKRKQCSPRSLVGVPQTNPYIFARTTADTPLSGNEELRKVTDSCPNLQYPERINSTALRKYIATVSQILDMTPKEVEMLARQLGHDDKTHKENYRLAHSTQELTAIVQSNKIVKRNVIFSVEIGSLVHQIQIERGTSALYISSGGDPFIKPRLQSLYSQTNSALSALSKWIPLSEEDSFQSRNEFQADILDFRNNLDPRNTTLREVIEFYTNKNSVFIHMIGNSINLEKPFNFWTDLTAYQMLIFSKEQAGIERALGSTYFARGQFPLKDLLWYQEKKELGQHFLEQCIEYSSYARTLIDTKYTYTSLAEDLTTMRDMIVKNSLLSPSVISGTIWFDNMTEFIDILKYIQDKLASRIVQHANDENSQLEERMTLSAIELTVAIILIPIVAILVANIIRKIHRYSSDLQIKTSELENERKRTEELLYQLLPRTVARKLMLEGNTVPESYQSATIMFSDVVGFTTISSRSTPMQVISMLNTLYLTIDGCLENFDVYKVETIGDGYMVASGLPMRNKERHVEEIAKLSLDLLKTIGEMEISHLSRETLRLRIGFNTGPCVAGVVGIRMPRYCVFGDTVNTASRMESTGLPLRIQMTAASARMLQRRVGYVISERGTVEVKGKGTMHTYWLEGYKSSPSENASNCHSENIVIEVKQQPA